MPPDPDEPLRLGDFIVQHLETIVSAWEDYARAHWPEGDEPNRAELRDNSVNMLRAVVADMKSEQSDEEQKRKSEGTGNADSALGEAALKHAKDRLSAGFDIVMVFGEFRALRASVMRIWQDTDPPPYPGRSDDLVRFNEAIDQLIATSVEAHSARVEQGRRLFLGIIGHDLRQPLGSVRLLASALMRSGGGDLAPIVAKIQAGVDAMDALVRDLLDLSGSQLGRPMAMHPAHGDLGELAREMIAQLEAAHPDKVFTLSADGDLTGRWDGSRLRQLLSNLLGNAVQHGNVEGAIELALRSADGPIELTVRSSGRQIPKQHLNLLFEPLVRHSLSESSDQFGSMGLGLFICREIVRAHRGTIEVKSSDEGVTVFTIVLPRNCPPEAARPE